MRRRSNLLVLLGLASFVLGLVAVYLITGDDDDGGGGGTDRVSVLVATEDIPAGALGDDVIASGAVEVQQVEVADRQVDVLTSASQLSGSRLTQLFPRASRFRTEGIASLGGPRAHIPEGFEAVALDIDFVAGGANTIAPNDRVNVFLQQSDVTSLTVDGEGGVTGGIGGRVQLLLTNVLVLDVPPTAANLTISQPADPAVASTSSGGSIVVIVAVSTVDAEKVIFGSTVTNSELYLSRVRLDDEGNPPPPAAGGENGRSLENILAQSAAEAFAESNTNP